MKIRDKTIFTLAALACIGAVLVIALGAYVRLSHAGLGCPDWPGCYGHMVLPAADQTIDASAYPDRPVQTDKAWKEMTHRYAAGGLGLLVLMIAARALSRYRGAQLIAPLALLALITFQAALGMWTVTLLLKPLIVTAHLLGGMLTLALLCWLMMSYMEWAPARRFVMGVRPVYWLGVFTLLLLIVQIALGGWTSSNYAALACTGFPQCNGVWWPPVDFKNAFVLWRGLGIDYEGGVLDHPARTAIHMAHRIGAAVVACVLGLLVLLVWVRMRTPGFRIFSAFLLLLLATQIGLGIANVTQALPLPVATAHNGVAALLLASLVCLLHRLHSMLRNNKASYAHTMDDDEN
jgi:cytochrome c oxidase assembly protein subunit 15